MLWSIFIPPIIFFLALSVMNICDAKYKDSKKEEESRKTFKKLIFTLGCLLFSLPTINIITLFTMKNGRNGISFFGAALTSIAVFGSVLVKRYNAPRLTVFLKKSAVCAVVILAAEVFIFNGKSLTGNKSEKLVDNSTFSLGSSAELDANGDIRITGNTILTLENPPKDVSVMTLSLDADGASSTPFDVMLSMTDGNFSKTPVLVQHKRTCGQNSELSLSFRPYGQIGALSLSFSGITVPVTLHQVRLMNAVPYSFSSVRFTLLLALFVLIAAIKEFRLYSVTYDRKKRSHIIAVAAVTIICTFSGLFFCAPGIRGREYTGTEKYIDDPFALTLDAFEKNQVHLDLDVAPGLAEFENVYDQSIRSASDTFYFWDLAYYNGHYYSYFGVAPVLTFYYPYYFLTGRIPNMGTANNFYAVLGILFMCLTVLAAIRLLKIKTNLILLLLMMPTAAASMGFWFVANEIDRYTLPTVSGLCFLMICLYTGMTACATDKKRLKPVLLVISGAALALTVASRPTIALCAAVLVPFFIGILLNKNEKLSHRLGLAGCFLVPLAIGAALIMKYNAARFGSPFEFGAVYQLTVSDIHANKLSLSSIPSAIYHYFLNMPKSKTTFPFFETTFNPLDNYGAYAYAAVGFGALVLPVILYGVFLQPEAFAPKSKELTDRRRRQFLTICFVFSAALAWADFCLGGFITHYVFDIMPLMTFAAMIGIFRSTDNPAAHKRRYVLSAASMALTIIFMLGLCINYNESTLLKRFPQILDHAEDIIIFWK